VKRRVFYIGGAALLGLMALPFLPQSWYARMSTLEATEEDTSASTRMAVWEWTVDYANSHPMGGGFDAYRGNKFTYKLPKRVQNDDNTVAVEYVDHTDQARAYHSAVFEMLGEQGWPGLGLWLWSASAAAGAAAPRPTSSGRRRSPGRCNSGRSSTSSARCSRGSRTSRSS
jgi:O-antigen ligase